MTRINVCKNYADGLVCDLRCGKHYNYFRDYDPSISRYLQSDPIGLEGGINTYGYVAANPLLNIDPEGKLYSKMCGRCRIEYDSDNFKGAHSHWYCPGQPKGCMKKNGDLCDGSAPPSPEVKQCLIDWGRIPAPKKEMCGPTCQNVAGGIVIGGLIVGGICLGGPLVGLGLGVAGLAAQ